MNAAAFLRCYRCYARGTPQRYQRECGQPVRVIVVAEDDDHDARLRDAGLLKRAGIQTFFIIGWDETCGLLN